MTFSIWYVSATSGQLYPMQSGFNRRQLHEAFNAFSLLRQFELARRERVAVEARQEANRQARFMSHRATGDLEAFKEWRDMEEARRGHLVDAAFRDILAGKFDTDIVHEAMKLGTHADYPKLKQAQADALRVKRHAGVR